jgi:hypothetical protein
MGGSSAMCAVVGDRAGLVFSIFEMGERERGRNVRWESDVLRSLLRSTASKYGRLPLGYVQW